MARSPQFNVLGESNPWWEIQQQGNPPRGQVLETGVKQPQSLVSKGVVPPGSHISKATGCFQSSLLTDRDTPAPTRGL